MQELDDENALMHAGLTADGRLLALAAGSTSLADWTLFSGVADVGKILVGKLPKFSGWQTRVWQIESN